MTSWPSVIVHTPIFSDTHLFHHSHTQSNPYWPIILIDYRVENIASQWVNLSYYIVLGWARHPGHGGRSCWVMLVGHGLNESVLPTRPLSFHSRGVRPLRRVEQGLLKPLWARPRKIGRMLQYISTIVIARRLGQERAAKSWYTSPHFCFPFIGYCPTYQGSNLTIIMIITMIIIWSIIPSIQSPTSKTFLFCYFWWLIGITNES